MTHSVATVEPMEARPGVTGRLTAWGKETLQEVGDIRFFEFVCGFLLISGIPIGLGFKVESLIFAGMILISISRTPRFDLGKYQLFIPIFAVAAFYLAIISVNTVDTEYAADWRGRLLRMTVMTMVVFVFASDRLQLKSTVYGIVAALFVNVPLFFAGLVPDSYGGYLTGWTGDKNYAGLVYCLFGIMVLAYVKSGFTRFGIFVFFAGSLWMTGSRTSLAAFASAVVWLLVAPRINMVWRWVLAALIYTAVIITAEDYSQIGVFSDREGSDLLRARIDAASKIKVDGAGFFGSGLGEAVVELDGRAWFFHNSYWTALVEGGWPWLLFILAMLTIVALKPFAHTLNRDQIMAQALGIALLICAWRLGEVFMTMPWALVMAYSLQSWIYPQEARRASPASEVRGVHPLRESRYL